MYFIKEEQRILRVYATPRAQLNLSDDSTRIKVLSKEALIALIEHEIDRHRIGELSAPKLLYKPGLYLSGERLLQ